MDGVKWEDNKMKNVAYLLVGTVFLSIFGILLFAEESMTFGAYLLGTIVLLSFWGILLFAEKEKRMRGRIFMVGGIVFSLSTGILAVIDVYRDKIDTGVSPGVNGIVSSHPFSPRVPDSHRGGSVGEHGSESDGNPYNR